MCINHLTKGYDLLRKDANLLDTSLFSDRLSIDVTNFSMLVYIYNTWDKVYILISIWNALAPLVTCDCSFFVLAKEV